MPQLDIVTFFSQFFWLCLFFIGFYYIIYKYFLPQYSRCILFRDKFTHSSITGSSANIEEKNNIEESLYMYTISAVGFSKSFFQESKSKGVEWHKHLSKKTNENSWKAPNILYVKTFGAKQASKNLCESCISYMVGMSVYIEGLSKTCVSYGENTSNALLLLRKQTTESVLGNSAAKPTGSTIINHTNDKQKPSTQKNTKTVQKEEGKLEGASARPLKKNTNIPSSNTKTATGKSNTSKK